MSSPLNRGHSLYNFSWKTSCLCDVHAGFEAPFYHGIVNWLLGSPFRLYQVHLRDEFVLKPKVIASFRSLRFANSSSLKSLSLVSLLE